MAYLHSKKICHRDLKLSNILMSSPHSKSKLKISDFGVSKKWSTIEELKSYVGKCSGGEGLTDLIVILGSLSVQELQ